MRFPACLSHKLPRGVGVGWGVGCNDIVELARMVDATSPVGLGWGVMTSLNLHAWLMLRHPWGWGGVGWDVITFVAHEHMLHATQLLRFLLGCSRSLRLHTCSMLCNCCVSCWDAHFPCTCTHGHSRPAVFWNLNNDSTWIYE